jgi:hypothetical protein
MLIPTSKKYGGSDKRLQNYLVAKRNASYKQQLKIERTD